MVGAHNISVNFSRFNFIFKPLRNQNIIYPPANVARSSVGKMTPPCVIALTLLEESECINKAGVNEVLESRALFLGKALFAFIRLIVCKIIRRMRDVKIA